ncbi:MAG: RseA family anti-sigma factor [Gammaproteobacteria bacterium]
MSEQNKISIVLDEFTGDERSIKALDEVLGDVNLQYGMRRYQMIGEVMRHELPEHIDTEFSTGIMSQIDQIKTPAGSAKRFSSADSKPSIWAWPFLKPVAGLAIAASVALVSVTLWQSINVGSQSGQVTDQLANVDQLKIQQLANRPVQFGAVTVSSKINDGMRWKVIDGAPVLQQKLNAYLVSHTEYSNSMQGLIPQVRVVGFDFQQ